MLVLVNLLVVFACRRSVFGVLWAVMLSMKCLAQPEFLPSISNSSALGLVKKRGQKVVAAPFAMPTREKGAGPKKAAKTF